MQTLARTLERIDGRGYTAYRDIRGAYAFRDFTLDIEHVQGDPFAAPSRLRVEIPPRVALLAADLVEGADRRRGTADCLLRIFAARARSASSKAGSGKSGLITVDAPGQEMLPRTAAVVEADGSVTLRFYVGLPAAGRRVLGREAYRLLCEALPAMVEAVLDTAERHLERVRAHAAAAEDQAALRAQLSPRGLVAFVGEGAILPRASGRDDTPMAEGAVAWEGPAELDVTLRAPNAGEIRGTGVPQGLTLICGGGYHGKSTLLDALARGIYDHVPGDGRERVVSRGGAFVVRAEDGRRVAGVDISGFIDGLPAGRSTRHFYSEDASGSTSQAAGVIEALELGADVLLMDEDTCATNFMIRDARMQALVAADREPITPLVDRVAELKARASLVLVMGGSGAFFEHADTVIVMDAYRPLCRTEVAHRIAAERPSERAEGDALGALEVPARVPLAAGFDPSRGKKAARVRGRQTREIEFGRETIEIAALEQLVDPSQTRLIGDAILFALDEGLIDGRRSLREIVDALGRVLEDAGPIGLTRRGEGDRAGVRGLEIGAAINRLRTLRVKAPA